MRIFLDANILFSAAKSDGAIRHLLQLLVAEGHTLVADAFVVEEARRNLARKGTGESLDALAKLLTVVEVAVHGTAVDEAAAWLAWLPAKDRPVLAAAAGQHCEALITGDLTHFGAGYGKVFSGVTLYSPAMAAEALLGD